MSAKNAKRQLFGCGGAQRIGNQSAAAIVDAAKQSGQEDDITVVAIQFAGALVLVAS